MVVALVSTLNMNGEKVAATTYGYFLQTAVAAGNTIVAAIVFDNAATVGKPLVSSISKVAGETNSWVFLGRINHPTSTSAGAFAGGELWAIKTTVTWPTSSTLTVTFDTSITQKAVRFMAFSGVEATLRSTTGTNYSTTTTASSATTTGTTPVVGDLALGFTFGSNVAAAQAGDTDTTGGSWDAANLVGVGTTGGSGATNNYGILQYKILTGANHQTYNNSAAMTAGNGAIVAILRATIDPLITQAAYRVYGDGTESGSTALAAQDTAPTVVVSSDANVQVRLRLQETAGGVQPATTDWTLQWEKNTSGTWTNLQTTLTNLVPNPSIEVDTTGWAANVNGTIARDNTKGGAISDSGSWAVAATSTAAGNYYVYSAFPYVAVLPSTTYRVSAYTQVQSGKSLIFGVSYYTSGGVYIGEGPFSSLSDPFWERQDHTFTTPSNAGQVRVGFTGSAAAGGEKFWVDAVMLTEGSTLYNYFDGATSGASWSGTAHNSASTLVVVGTNAVPYVSSLLDNTAPSTNRLTGGSGTFVAGDVAEDGVCNDQGLSASNHTELVYSVTLKSADLANADSLRFRVLRDGVTTGMTYTAYPTITVSKVTTPQGTGTGSWSFTGAAVGYRLPKASPTGAWSFAGAAVGKRVAKAAPVGAWSFTGTAVGAAPAAAPGAGIGAGTWVFTGAAVGKRVAKAAPTGTWTWTGAAVGKRSPVATATGTWAFTGAAVGKRTALATGTGTWSLAGSAVGDAPGADPITLRSAGTVVEATAAATTNVPYPPTISAGDVLVVMGSVFNAGLVTNPAGWTQVASLSATGNTLTPDVFQAIIVATGSETGTLTVTHNNNVNIFQMLAFSGVDNTTPQDTTAVTNDAGTTTTTVLPDITTVTAGAALVYVAAHLNTAMNATAPTNFTETGDRVSGTRSGTFGYRILTGAAGAQGTSTVNWTGGSGRSVGALMALRPAAPAVGPKTGTATGTWAWVGAAVGKRTPVATVTGTWSFTGAAVGKRVAGAVTAGAWSFTGTAVGSAPAVAMKYGTATGTWTFTGAAVGKRVAKANSTGTFTFTGTAVGDAPPNRGTATGTWNYTGAAVGKRVAKATGTGTWTWVGAAVGKRVAKATPTGAWAFTGAAVGYRLPKATSSGAWSYAGAAVGKRTPKAAPTGTWSFTGAAAGKRTPKATSTGTWTWTGVATGTAPVVGQNDGFALGAVHWTGVAAARTTHRATAAGAWTWVGTAAAQTTHRATTTGAWSYSGAAVGKKPAKAITTGTWTWVGTGVGKRNPKATPTGNWTWTGVATGRRVPKATATGTWVYTGTAAGLTTHRATAAGSWLYIGSAFGDAPPNQGTAAGTLTWVGVGVGLAPALDFADGTAAGVWWFTGYAAGLARLFPAPATRTSVAAADPRVSIAGRDPRVSVAAADPRTSVAPPDPRVSVGVASDRISISQ